MSPVVSPSKEAIQSQSGPDNLSEDDLQGQGEQVRERLLQLCKALVQKEIIVKSYSPLNERQCIKTEVLQIKLR